MPTDPFVVARRRLTLRFTALVAALVVLGGAAAYGLFREARTQAWEGAQALAVRSALESVAYDDGHLDVKEDEFHEEFEELAASLGVVSVTVWDDAGVERAHAAVRGLRPGRDGAVVEHLAGAVSVGRSAFPGGTVALARHDADRAELDRLLWAFAGAALLTVPGAFAAGWLLTGWALRPLRDSAARQRAFVADASHELRTPLAILRAHADVTPDDPAAVRAAMAQIAKTTAALGALVDDLRFLGGLDAGAPLVRVAFALDELADDVVTAFAPTAPPGASLAAFAPPSEVVVDGDPAQLERLVGALVDNALRHGGGHVEVRVGRDGRVATLTVEDGGPGFDPALLPRAFDRFARGRGAAPGGQGLGLAIARAVVDAHGGTIALDRGGRGARGVVTLPPAG